MGGFLTVPTFLDQFPQIGVLFKPGVLHIAQLTGFTVAVWTLGCFTSAVITIFIGDVLGRKKLMYLGLTFLLLGEIIKCSSFQWGQFVAGRFISGMGNGFNCATVPAWQAECTKAHRRGTLLMLSAGASIAAGLTFGFWMDFAFAWLDPSSASWRVPIALQIIFILATASILFFLPESPRWLILKGREDEALQVLSALNNEEPTTHEIRQEFLQIKDAVVEMTKASFSTTLRMGDYRDLHRVVLAVGLQFFQQAGGISFMTQYYAQMFSQQYIWDPWQARLLAAGAGTLFFLCSFVPVWCIDRICGRRSLLLFGTSGMLVCMIILAVMLEVNTRASLDAGTAFVFVFCSFWAMGWQGMSWLYQVEIVPLRIRGTANAMSTGANWLANFIIVLVAPVAFNNTKWRTYLIFVSTNAVILPIVYFFYPETGMRCLEEVDYIFFTADSSPRPWLDVVKIANDEPLWYGQDIEEPYDYEASAWHQRHVRFSHDVKNSDGETTTLRPGESEYENKFAHFGSDSSGTMFQDDRPRDNGIHAAPSPVIGRTSSDLGRRSGSGGRIA